MNILVTGGTGVLGRSVVDRLVTAGHRVRVLSRDPSRASSVRDVEPWAGDLRALPSLGPALSDVETVVHCASDVRSPVEVDVAGTANLVAAMRGLDVRHLVYVSIVGVDQIPIKYYRAKRDVESIVEHQNVPWTIQRATQFHPFVAEMLAKSARRPLIACPRGLRFQPVAVEEVADRVVQHVESGAAGRAADLGGREVLTLRDLASTWMLATGGRRRPLLPVPFPGAAGRAFKAGANLCAGHSSAGLTWTQYLDGYRSVRGAV
ncbi:NAD-dependent epimerase/dehydratase family protein [Ornithinimicrobium ciconiae]|uniref:NAD-dependent epimerase/dehydratase family protein n=1 Tax=Ornithinimicrobium ciconiae TaxID=2594265 RepID=A0A516GEP2_9MICO|nr:NAD(P)H-binding protein [Ornithinimicrobium ciconiae]QDO89986.1 NAD-dependent epimerase/dehydratase family protein [Ornithinimicrobium ciconiae]